MLKKMMVSLGLAVSLLMGGAVATQSVVASAAAPATKIQEVTFQKKTPPKPDPTKDKVVQANLRSHIKGVAQPNPPAMTKQQLAVCSPACYYYAGRYRNTSGVIAAATNSSIAVPSMDQQDYHTLWEMTIQNGPLIIEFGWNRDRVLYGETYPTLTTRLFGSVWWDNGGVSTFCGYNGGCGYTDYAANPINLGSDISAQNNVLKNFQIIHDGTSHVWWLNYDSGWIGYFPDNLTHGNSFTSGNAIQTFDEGAFGHYASCTDEGNSWLADKTKTFPQTGQQVSSLNEDTGSGYALAAYSGTIETNAAKWNVDEVSNYSSYYGGPGFSPNPGACP